MINGTQCRAARAWLGLEAQELARLVGIRPLTIQRFERGSTTPRARTLEAIQQELERRGIRFTFTETDGGLEPLGIELIRKPQRRPGRARSPKRSESREFDGKGRSV